MKEFDLFGYQVEIDEVATKGWYDKANQWGCECGDIKHMEMSEDELVKKWLKVFGKNVDKKLIEEHVNSYGNHLWHLFTWGEVPCLQGDDAKKAFDDLQYEEAIRFYDGYAGHIEKVSVIGKITAKEVDKDRESDVYIVAKDFSWTYVRTHETGLCGPYFCQR